MGKLVRPWGMVGLVLVLYLGGVFAHHQRDPLTFVTLGECYRTCQNNRTCPIPPQTTDRLTLEGYDGQFNYYIARQPTQAAPCIDVPAYRYQRILLPLLAWGLSLGKASLLSWLFIGINSLALLLSTYALEHLLLAEGRKPWFALSYGLFAGVLAAVRLSTSEPLAYGLVILALWAYHKRHMGLLCLSLGLAAFAKETTLIVSAGVGLWFAYTRQWRWLVILGSMVLLPFLAWQVYLYHWLGEFGMGSGGADATAFELLPFGGILKIRQEWSNTEFLTRGVIFALPAVVLPTVWGLLVSLYDFKAAKVSLYTCLLLTSSLIMPFIPFSTYREYWGILRFMPPLVLMVVLYSAERDLRRPLMYSTLWITLLSFLISAEV